MPAAHTRVLTIEVVSFGLADVVNAVCRAVPIFTQSDRELPILPHGDGRAAWPDAVEGLTDDQGECRLSIVPTPLMPAGWRYEIQVRKGRFTLSRIISMPDSDSILSDLVDSNGGEMHIDLLTLVVGPATAAGVFAASESYSSATGDFLVAVAGTDAAPRILLRAPNGNIVSKVYDRGFDITADFTRRPGTQDWLSNREYVGAIMLLVRTLAATG